ncbi:MAG TPA: Flp family type IVb pilin [Oscillospiraceae bacterium]|nr:Flp family type IVb pilin [Oscillospiraceae bacterium]HPF55295.1 Flp family type IVb pilin [Clostridiales bacterium]HPK34699.1 Flp family type IVb pilin [Oscillospiraceae bacterium]HPR74537.1 Flp family type IVb pilin [Oscillospiraceae bacterium]
MLKEFFNDESGQGMVEYGLIIALVAVAVIVAITALGDSLKGIFNKAASELSDAITSA